MTIAFVVDAIWPYRIRLYERLSQLYDIDFLVTRESQIDEVGSIRPKPVHNWTFLSFELTAGLLPMLLRRSYDVIIWGDAGSGKGTRGVVANLINALTCVSAGRLRRKPFILWFGGWEWREKDQWERGSLANAIRRSGASLVFPWLLSHAAAVVTYGSMHKHFYTSLGVDANRIFVAPSSSIIEHKAFSEWEMADLKEKLRIVGKKVVLYVGRLGKRKNVDVLIQAFCQLGAKASCLLIVGDGEDKSYLQELCRQLDAKDVYFLGQIGRDKLGSYYYLCDVFVYPTSREPWGLAVNEAMQFGKPVIATPRVAAAHDLLKQGVNGFIVPERDATALGQAIGKVLSDEELARKMGQESKRIIEQGFTYEHMVKGFEEAIEFVRR